MSHWCGLYHAWQQQRRWGWGLGSWRRRISSPRYIFFHFFLTKQTFTTLQVPTTQWLWQKKMGSTWTPSHTWHQPKNHPRVMMTRGWAPSHLQHHQQVIATCWWVRLPPTHNASLKNHPQVMTTLGWAYIPSPTPPWLGVIMTWWIFFFHFIFLYLI